MIEFLEANDGQIQNALSWVLHFDGFRVVSATMYVIFAAGLLLMGVRHHNAVVRGENPPGQFPSGYFTFLVIQLLPLTVTGFILSDAFVIWTRLGTLVVALLVYALVTSADGTFNIGRIRRWSMFWLGVAILGPMAWLNSDLLRTFVHTHETAIVWSSIAFMFLFLIFGQNVTAYTLYRHYMSGNYSVKRISLQFARLAGFVFQAIHYWIVPSAAVPLVVFGKAIDPIFLQGAVGTIGVLWVILLAAVGAIFGTHARQAKKYQDSRE